MVHQLASDHQVSVISADSRQVVCGFDIGSAKPNKDEQEKYDYHLLDMIEPGQRYSAFDFRRDALTAIDSVFSSGSAPLVCGGAGLYLRALTEGIFEIPDPDPELRVRLENMARELGGDFLHNELKKVDPESAESIHPNNVIRVCRALEIYHITGETKSSLANQQRQQINDTQKEINFHQFALTPPISQVYEAINGRVERMLDSGWPEEVEKLIKRYGAETIRQARAIGYSELVDYLADEVAWATTVELIKRNTRRFAKRQMTWIRGVSQIELFEDAETLLQAAAKHLAESKLS